MCLKIMLLFRPGKCQAPSYFLYFLFRRYSPSNNMKNWLPSSSRSATVVAVTYPIQLKSVTVHRLDKIIDDIFMNSHKKKSRIVCERFFIRFQKNVLSFRIVD